MARFCLEKFCVRAISLLCSLIWLHWLLVSKQAKNLFVRKAKRYSTDKTDNPAMKEDPTMAHEEIVAAPAGIRSGLDRLSSLTAENILLLAVTLKLNHTIV